jgi:predicted nucleotidyltransferase
LRYSFGVTVDLPEELKNLGEDLEKIVSKYIEPGHGYELFFFGSRVTGKNAERSDIDVGIKGKEPLPSGALSAIKEEIEKLPTLYKIDFVDFADTAKVFNKVALEDIHLIKKYD